MMDQNGTAMLLALAPAGGKVLQGARQSPEPTKPGAGQNDFASHLNEQSTEVEEQAPARQARPTDESPGESTDHQIDRRSRESELPQDRNSQARDGDDAAHNPSSNDDKAAKAAKREVKGELKATEAVALSKKEPSESVALATKHAATFALAARWTIEAPQQNSRRSLEGHEFSQSIKPWKTDSQGIHKSGANDLANSITEMLRNWKPDQSDARASQKPQKSEGPKEGAAESTRLKLDPEKWSVHRAVTAAAEKQSRAESTGMIKEEAPRQTEQRSVANAFAIERNGEASEKKSSQDGDRRGDRQQTKANGPVNPAPVSGDQGAENRRVDFTQDLRTATESRESARANRDAFNDLVQKARVNVKSDGSSTASIRLNPQQLGRMTLNLQVNHNQVTAQVIVENQTARQLIRNELEHLQQELRHQGINVEQITIRVRESFSFNAGSDSDFGQTATGENQADADREAAHAAENDPESSSSDAVAVDDAAESYEDALAIEGGRSRRSEALVNLRI